MKPPRKKSRTTTPSRASGTSEKSPPTNRPIISPGKKWLFRLVALVVLPVFILVVLELSLRVAGYGHSYRLFKPVTRNGTDYFINDDLFGLKFFPPEMTRSTSSFEIEAKKPPGTYRIFILGESAAMGDPEPAYGAGRYLEILLRERYPGQRFEVVNLGITAINSHVILPIARECAQHEGDLWLIYMGNNEMVGPYGAATVFGRQAPPVAFVRLSLAIKQSRVGQLLLAAARKLSKKPQDTKAWGGMQMFVDNKISPDDPRRAMVYKNFRANLQDIVRAGLNSGAKVLLSTVAVNLKDCPPFGSLSFTNLASADLDKLNAALAAANKPDSGPQSVVQQFATANAIFPKSADLHYGWGEAWLKSGQKVEARNHLQTACDLDTLSFRADTAINGAILHLGENISSPNLDILDSASALAVQTPSGINGQESFYEHVHLNFDGNYRLGKIWAEKISSMLPGSITNHEKAPADWASQETCERRLGLTDWNRVFVFEAVLPRYYSPPLNGQPNNDSRIADLQTQISRLRAHLDTNHQAEARAIYIDAIQRAPDDYFLHENYASFLMATKDLPAAIAQDRLSVQLVPQDFVANYQLGRLLAQNGDFREAESVLKQSLAAHPGFTEAWVELAGVHCSENQLPLALEEYQRARKLRPDDAAIPYQLGKIFSRLNRPAESIQSFRDALGIRPDYWEAHYTLGGELGSQNQLKEAADEFAQVIRLEPKFPGAHLNYGVALLKLGQVQDAIQEFQETLRLEPDNKIAPDYLTQARSLLHRKP